MRREMGKEARKMGMEEEKGERKRRRERGRLGRRGRKGKKEKTAIEEHSKKKHTICRHAVRHTILTNDKSADGVGDQSSQAASECSPIVMTINITEGVCKVSKCLLSHIVLDLHTYIHTYIHTYRRSGNFRQ